MNRANLSGMKLHQGISFHPAMMRVPDSPVLFWPGCALLNLDGEILRKNPFRPAAGRTTDSFGGLLLWAADPLSIAEPVCTAAEKNYRPAAKARHPAHLHRLSQLHLAAAGAGRI